MLTSSWMNLRTLGCCATDPGRQLRMQQCIAKGGFSLVYKATWKHKDEFAAVKRVRLRLSIQEKCCLRLGLLEKEKLPTSSQEKVLQEAEILRELQANDFVLKLHFTVNKS